MIGHIYHNKEVIDKGLVAFMFLLLIISAYLTEMLGLHALFGAFIAGVVMPSNVKFRKIMTEKVEDVSLALFLPLFFVSTGLRTEIGPSEREQHLERAVGYLHRFVFFDLLACLEAELDERNELDLTALHLTVGSDVNPLHTDNFEEVSFGPILYGAKKLGINIETRYEVSNNAGQDITDIVNTSFSESTTTITLLAFTKPRFTNTPTSQLLFPINIFVLSLLIMNHKEK